MLAVRPPTRQFVQQLNQQQSLIIRPRFYFYGSGGEEPTS
jgi:hypothetical protein